MTLRKIAVLCVGVLLPMSGCSVVVPGSGVPDPNDPVMTLDTGNLPTTPRKPLTSEAQQRVLAANMLGDRAVAPWDVDPAFITAGSRSVQVVLSSQNLGSGMETSMRELLGRGGIQYGFASARHVDRSAVTTGLVTYLLRMTDDASATDVVGGFRTEPSEGRDDAITERPDVIAKRYDPIPGAPHTTIALMFNLGPIVVFMRSWGADPAKAHRNAVLAIDRQRSLLAGFAPPGPSDVTSLPVDKDGIVSYTVTATPPTQGTFDPDYGFRSAAGQLHWSEDPIATARLFAKAGVDLVGYGRNIVFRARDPEGAQMLANEWHNRSADEKKATGFSIAGLPTAKCRTYATGALDEPRSTCYLPVGRYLSEYSDSQPEKVRQVTSAAYLILRHAS
ncbi:DUF7373 family lipoprotein [Tsukamurella paurometabola]|uniref:Lipoprotein n=1 Tax=Tsukamurella paurometabola TaxID=2061 RepID=A0ABS5NE18_TSUPA|nr:hypothetical protein [Tsukamurella paurometabola]MBS4101887.1 hypothetical protein [Tsukamurella paurometabola]